MRVHLLKAFALFALFCSFVTPPSFAQEKNIVSETERKEIADLITLLGNDSWRTREKASADLGKLKRKPRTQLIETIRTSSDPEVVRRADRLLTVIFNEEAWDPVVKEVSFKRTKVSRIYAAVGKDSGLRFSWGPHFDPSAVPEDAEIDFSARGTVAEILSQLEAMTSTRLVDNWSTNDSHIRIMKADKNPLGKATAENLWVTFGTRPFRYGTDGTLRVNLQIISDGNQPLAGLYMPIKLLKAVTDTGEVLSLATEMNPFSVIRGTTDPARKLEVGFELSAASKPFTRLSSLELELSLSTCSNRQTLSFDLAEGRSEKSYGTFNVECRGLENAKEKIANARFRARGYCYGTPVFAVVDSEGKQVGSHYVSREYDGSENPPFSAYFDMSKIGTPSRIEVQFYTRTAHKCVRVSLNDTAITR
jgi:hypothetical protein